MNRRVSFFLAALLTAVGLLSTIAFLVALYVAIWSPGNDAWDGTAGALFFQAFVLDAGSALVWAARADAL